MDMLLTDGIRRVCALKNVLYVPKLANCLVSVPIEQYRLERRPILMTQPVSFETRLLPLVFNMGAWSSPKGLRRT